MVRRSRRILEKEIANEQNSCFIEVDGSVTTKTRNGEGRLGTLRANQAESNNTLSAVRHDLGDLGAPPRGGYCYRSSISRTRKEVKLKKSVAEQVSIASGNISQDRRGIETTEYSQSWR